MHTHLKAAIGAHLQAPMYGGLQVICNVHICRHLRWAALPSNIKASPDQGPGTPLYLKLSPVFEGQLVHQHASGAYELHVFIATSFALQQLFLYRHPLLLNAQA